MEIFAFLPYSLQEIIYDYYINIWCSESYDWLKLNHYRKYKSVLNQFLYCKSYCYSEILHMIKNCQIEDQKFYDKYHNSPYRKALLITQGKSRITKDERRHRNHAPAKHNKRNKYTSDYFRKHYYIREKYPKRIILDDS